MRSAQSIAYAALAVSLAFVVQHPYVVAKFARASIRGWNQHLRDPAPTNALLLKLNSALKPAA